MESKIIPIALFQTKRTLTPSQTRVETGVARPQVAKLPFDGTDEFHISHIRDTFGLGEEHIVFTPGNTANLLANHSNAFIDSGMVYEITPADKTDELTYAYLAIDVNKLISSQALGNTATQMAIMENIVSEMGNSILAAAAKYYTKGKIDFAGKLIKSFKHLYVKDVIQYIVIRNFIEKCRDSGINLNGRRVEILNFLQEGFQLIEAFENTGFKKAV